ncbi:hypothetical protein G5I_14379 [Acromyrmex echinatior]|uniref:Uncharacterized protein n=1 Tax=Acromyrmex echinatior TaxID=103372 RepID=F4X7K2_ACREC|nr:hypothetical protein G5I_14379 [Acromyrmex echinatior]
MYFAKDSNASYETKDCSNIYNIQKELQKVEETVCSSSSSSFSVQSDIIIDLTQLHVDQIGLFHRLIEIADEVDDLTHTH